MATARGGKYKKGQRKFIAEGATKSREETQQLLEKIRPHEEKSLACGKALGTVKRPGWKGTLFKNQK